MSFPPLHNDSIDYIDEGDNILVFPAIGDDGGNPSRFFNGVEKVPC